MRLLRTIGVVVVGIVLASGSIVASDPIGVIAILTKVEMEPNDQAAERVKLWGAFAIPDRNMDFGRQPAKKGVMYFKLPPGREAQTRNEWTDLKTMAGTERVVGFGSYFMRANPSAPVMVLDVAIHAEDATAVPVVYPSNIGVQRFGTGPAEIAAQLRRALGLR